MTPFECSCLDCQDACKRKPGWFKPGELEKTAKILELTPQELFDKYLAVDWWALDGQADAYVIAPALTSEEPGGMYPGNPMGRCVFLTEEELCLIHEAKPFECASLNHEDTAQTTGSRHAAVAHAWNTPAHQAEVERLLGEKPYARDIELSFLGGLW